MNLLIGLALVVTVGHATVSTAGESIVQAGTRHAKQMAAAEAAAAAPSGLGAAMPAVVLARTTMQQKQGSVSRSDMRKTTKLLIYAGLAAGFAASVWAIDRHVLNITPSSLGTRQD